MDKLFNIDSPLMRGLTKVFDIGYLSIVWLLFSLPVITIGASTTALYYTAVKSIRRDRGYIFREFWNSFKKNFISATLIWFGMLILFGVLAFNIFYMNGMGQNYGGYLIGVYIVCIFLVVAIGCYAFPVLSRFEMKNMKIIRLSFYMVFRHLPSTILLVALIAISLVGFYVSPYFPAIILLWPATCAFIYSFIMENILKKYMPKRESNYTEDGKEIKEWYME